MRPEHLRHLHEALNSGLIAPSEINLRTLCKRLGATAPHEILNIIGTLVFFFVDAGAKSSRFILSRIAQTTRTAFAENEFQSTPRTTRRGLIIPLTKAQLETYDIEKVLERSRDGGLFMGWNKENALRKAYFEHRAAGMSAPALRRSMVWYENWPLTVAQTRFDEFDPQIVAKFKISMMGAPGVVDSPLTRNKSTGTDARC